MDRRRLTRALLATAVLCMACSGHAAAPLATHAERTGFAETGRYAEVTALCEAFAERYPQAVRCQAFGRTPEGRPMHVLVASSRGLFTPAQAHAAGIPVTLVQGGIHAGEIDGKDAGFLALRQLLDGEVAEGALQAQVLLFVPVFNVDGHERFGAWNRPNQNGPKEMGWRTTAQNLNLNRDYAKADAPEMQAMLRLVQAWDPLVVVDLHATNGAKFEHDISIQVEPLNGGDPGLRPAGRALRDAVIADLARAGSLPLPFYPSFVTSDEPASGFVDGVAPPRFSHGYFLLRNRIGMLVETHSWKPYPQRVRSTRNTVVSVLQQVARHGGDWRRMALEADARASAMAGRPVPLSYKATDAVREIAFRGYAYTRTPSEVSGATMTRYDDRSPQVWKVPLRDELVPDLVVDAPEAGYLVPAAHADAVAALLALHGVQFTRLVQGAPGLPTSTFRADSIAFAAAPVEGRQRTTLTGSWKAEPQRVGAGALFVPIAQPLARLAMALLEPTAADSMAAWGHFNNAFERKEYMEPYVAEEVARQMLRDPAVRAAFERRVAEDATFAADPAARLEFFYRRHPSWDSRADLYPVLRTSRAPAAATLGDAAAGEEAVSRSR